MRWTDLRTGYACNQHCRFCDQGDARTQIAEAGHDDVAAALSRIPHRDGVVLAGGEVTLRPDLPKLISAAKTLGFRRIGVQTNGRVLAAKGAASQLKALGLSDVVLALHAPQGALHDWLVETPGSFRLAVAAARASVAATLRLRLTTVVVRSNVPLLAAMPQLAGELGASSLRFTLCREQGAAAPNARMLVPRWELAGPALEAALDAARLAGVDAEIVGLPSCILTEHRVAVADRLDVPQPDRAYVVHAEQPRGDNVYGPDCAACQLRSICPGVNAAYALRYGYDELRPVGVPPALVPSVVTLELCDENGPRSTRILRQALVKLRAGGVAKLELVGEHAERNLVLKEAERLGFLGLEDR